METIGQAIAAFRDSGCVMQSVGISIKIPRADYILYHAALDYFKSIGEEFKVLKQEYREIANWLIDNNCKGLLLMGNHGMGKTVLARHLIPAVLKQAGKLANYYKATEIGSKLDTILSQGIIIIDDMGTEGVLCDYGNRRIPMDEIMDYVEQEGKLVIITTNLDKESIITRYGQGVWERIAATTKKVVFKGESLRNGTSVHN